MTDTARPPALPALQGIHHLKFAVADLQRSAAFYATAFGAARVTAWDHKHPDGSIYAYILDVPGLGTHLELRLDPGQASKDAGFDPVTFAVADRGALEAWAAVLDACGVEHSPILVGLIGWLLVFYDPDGRSLHIYTRATHGPEATPDFHSPWLQRR